MRKDQGNLWLIDRQEPERFREGSVSHVRGVCAGAPLHSSNPAGGGKQRAKRRTRGKVCHSVEDLQAREAKGWRLKKLTA